MSAAAQVEERRDSNSMVGGEVPVPRVDRNRRAQHATSRVPAAPVSRTRGFWNFALTLFGYFNGISAYATGLGMVIAALAVCFVVNKCINVFTQYLLDPAAVLVQAGARYFSGSWVPTDANPAPILRDLLGVASVARYAAEYFATQVQTLRGHPLTITSGARMDVSVPMAEMAYVAKEADRFHMEYKDRISAEWNDLEDIKRTLEHLIDDLSLQVENNHAAQGRHTSRQKEQKQRTTVEQQINRLIDLLDSGSKYRDYGRDESFKIGQGAIAARDRLGSLKSSLEGSKKVAEEHLFSRSSGGDGDTDGATNSKEDQYGFVSSVDDLAAQVWPQYVDMGAKSVRAEEIAICFDADRMMLDDKLDAIQNLRSRIKRREVDIRGAAMEVLAAVHYLMRSIENKYSVLGAGGLNE